MAASDDGVSKDTLLQRRQRSGQKNRPDRSTDGRLRWERLISHDIGQRVQDHIRRGRLVGKVQLSPAEWRLLHQARGTLGTWQGLLASVASFATLRLGPKVLARQLQKWYYQRYNIRNSPFTTTTTSADITHQSRSVYYGWLLLDGTLSVLLGATVATSRFDTAHAMDCAARFPLQPGTSQLSTELCPVIVHAWQDAQQRSMPLDNPLLPQLEMWRQLQRNCRARQLMEGRIRLERGGMDNAAVVDIPPPGVVLADKSTADETAAIF